MTAKIRDARNVFSDNPAVFLLDLQDALKDGFRVEDTIPGFPTLHAILKEVRVFKPDVVIEHSAQFDEDVITISNYDSMHFLLDIQNVLLAGYEVDTTAVAFDSLKSCRLKRIVEPVAMDELPAEELIKQAPRTQRRGRKPNPQKEI